MKSDEKLKMDLNTAPIVGEDLLYQMPAHDASQYIAYTSNGQILSIVGYQAWRSESESVLEIRVIWTDPTRRGRGLARDLLEVLIDAADADRVQCTDPVHPASVRLAREFGIVE